ncbi:MAG: DUF4038 domain-containing protein [Fimbriimonadaceae bacterium]|nr:DUF4038 domain-containing protein [Fimbriimonadaceae bacterium]
MRHLRVHDDRRHLAHADGTPYFYLADTAWELFHRLTEEEADAYFEDRARKGFTAIQAVLLAEIDGLKTPNRNGEVPLHDLDPRRPNEAYFATADRMVRAANARGLTMALLPTWGDKVNLAWGTGPVVFDASNARTYGRFLGERYRDALVIWVLGGDRPIENPDHLAIWRAMAQGLHDGDSGHHLITFHPVGGRSSSEWLHEEPWLDFNMCQSGHGERHLANDRFVAHDRALTPTKPCLDGEPRYEDIPVRFWEMQVDQGWDRVQGDLEEWRHGFFDDADAREALYTAVLAGTCGHTYGTNSVWQMWTPGARPNVPCRRTWREALDLPGAAQVGIARRLFESRPWERLEPAQERLTSGEGEGAVRTLCAAAYDGSFLVAYTTGGRSFELDLSDLGCGLTRSWWFDPRSGELAEAGSAPTGRPWWFECPTGEDWVLVLDNASRAFPPPG